MKSFKPIHFFIHPLPLLAVLLTAVNDHYLKYQFPGFITGKLSDFAGLFYFPLFISAMVVLLVRLYQKEYVFNRRLLLVVIVLTDVIFCLLKLNQQAKSLFVSWFSQNVFSIAVTSDVTDIIALSASAGCYFFARQFFETNQETIAE
jgi:hypothetical protein